MTKFIKSKYENDNVSPHYERLSKFNGCYYEIDTVVRCMVIDDNGNHVEYAKLLCTIIDNKIITERSYAVFQSCIMSMVDFVRISSRYIKEEAELIQYINKGLVLMEQIIGADIYEDVQKKRYSIYAYIMSVILNSNKIIDSVLKRKITISTDNLVPNLCYYTEQPRSVTDISTIITNMALTNFICPAFPYYQAGFLTSNRNIMALYDGYDYQSLDYFVIDLKEKIPIIDGLTTKLLFDYLYGYYVMVFKLNLIPMKCEYRILKQPDTCSYMINDEEYVFSNDYVGILDVKSKLITSFTTDDMIFYMYQDYREYVRDNKDFIDISIEKLIYNLQILSFKRAVNELIILAKKYKVSNNLNKLNGILHLAFLGKSKFPKDFMNYVFDNNKPKNKMKVNTTYALDNKLVNI